MSDTEIASEFIKIFDGEESDLLKKIETKELIDKIFFVFLYAEAQRHPIALLEAYTALLEVKEGAVGLIDCFNAKSSKHLPLFVPTGGAAMIRGDVKHMNDQDLAEYKKLIPKSIERILKHLGGKGADSIGTAAFQIANNLLKYTKPSELYPATEEQINKAGYRRIPSGTQGNNCAFFTLIHILNHNGIEVGDDFIGFMRQRLGLRELEMVELTNQGTLILGFLSEYLLSHGYPPPQLPSFRLNVIINFAGELIPYDNLASLDNHSPKLIDLFFYYNGINHFDALIPN